MVGELLRLGVPTEGVNVVVRRILEGLNDFKVEGWPTPEDIEKINNEDREAGPETEDDNHEFFSGSPAPGGPKGTQKKKKSFFY